MATAVTCSEVGAKLMSISCPQALGKQDFLRNAMNWTSFCPFLFGRVFLLGEIKQRRLAASKQWIDHPGGETPKIILNSQTYLARITRFFNTMSKGCESAWDPGKFRNCEPRNMFPPRHLGNASICILGMSFRCASSFANCVLAFAKRKCCFFFGG